MLYQNMKVVTSRGVVRRDIAVEEGKITQIKETLPGEGRDFRERYVLPCVADLHVHARDFEEQYKETVKTCTQAALAGGITFIADMPNTNPSVTTKDVFEKRKTLFKKESLCDFALNFGVVDTLEEILKVDPFFVKVYLTETTGKLLFRGDVQALMEMKVPVAIHSDLDTTKKWCPLNRKILYVCHIASKSEIEFLKTKDVLKEVTPHHLFLERSEDPLSRVNPPLGTEEDRKALWRNLENINIIASDHAPHTLEEKKEGASGIAGIETMLPLLLTAFNKKWISLEDIVKRLSENPCMLLNSLLNLKKGFFVGADADFTIVNLKKEWTIKASEFYSKANHSPFEGWKVKGQVEKTILKGEVVYER